ncbi:rRNA maturation RNase YbeY [Pseudogracilibacillus sp. SO30301A]|uniref:rRNA maturation RNase YbeY n=1 Tax=Pseudogracilibacillus sp. SO30301A TaxID=3098291 RepID=UPI00300E0535
MHIDVYDKTNTLSENQIQLLKDVLQFTAEKEKIVHDVELSVTIVTNEEIKHLNNQYRNKNEPTDVLSFQMDNPFMEHENEINYEPLQIGDIIISIEKVNEQATRYNHSLDRELTFLAIHGFLHLLGYTHDNKENEKVMFQKQDTILEEFKLGR